MIDNTVLQIICVGLIVGVLLLTGLRIAQDYYPILSEPLIVLSTKGNTK